MELHQSPWRSGIAGPARPAPDRASWIRSLTREPPAKAFVGPWDFKTCGLTLNEAPQRWPPQCSRGNVLAKHDM